LWRDRGWAAGLQRSTGLVDRLLLEERADRQRHWPKAHAAANYAGLAPFDVESATDVQQVRQFGIGVVG
jgi:hypothetical protein